MADDLDALLGPKPAGDDAAVREAVLRRTGRVIRRRPWVRRARLLTAAAGLVAAGGVAGWLAKDVPGPVTEYVVLPVGVALPSSEPAQPAPAEYVTAEQTELQAEQAADRATAAALYREAGDRYLADRNDSPQAARCYRLFLMRAGPDALTVTADDSWLLIALKQDQKEASREKGL
ncbi:MAG TPA: hypothetical protein VM533_02415 [Fimbriiglobus sp.]|jgi:hypothetical protein|nr:hypothetical protein [Fimbriiglobus sp.]